MPSQHYPIFDDVLGKFCVSFSGIDWEFYSVKDLIAEIKERIPKEHREYNPDSHYWLFEPEYERVVLILISLYFGGKILERNSCKETEKTSDRIGCGA